jgi:dephospho-CoA kinase
VGREIAARLAAEAGTDHVVVLDVPLMVETGRVPADGLVVVDVPEDVAVRRLVGQRGMSEADARARIASQASREERLAKADVVIDNAGGLDELAAQVDRVWAWAQGI